MSDPRNIRDMVAETETSDCLDLCAYSEVIPLYHWRVMLSQLLEIDFDMSFTDVTIISISYAAICWLTNTKSARKDSSICWSLFGVQYIRGFHDLANNCEYDKINVTVMKYIYAIYNIFMLYGDSEYFYQQALKYPTWFFIHPTET